MSNIWDDLDKKASEDNRVGNHDFMIDKVTAGFWPSGDPYIELDGRLVTVDNMNIRSRFTPEPSEDKAAEILKSGDRKVIRAISLAHQNAVVLRDQYGKPSLEDLQAGDTLRVKTDYEGKDKKFVKIIRILPKTESLTGNGTTADVPF